MVSSYFPNLYTQGIMLITVYTIIQDLGPLCSTEKSDETDG